MKTLIETNEFGLETLLNQRITFFGLNYIYTGNLKAFDNEWATLENAGIVYETGAFTDKDWKDYQSLPHPVRVRLSSIESVMVLK